MATRYTMGRLYEMTLEDVLPDPLQPRKFIEEQSLGELTASIKKHGVLMPILVRSGDEHGKFLIVSGERRYRASLAAGCATIPAILTSGNPLEISLVENLQREAFTAIEEAEAIDRLKSAHNYLLADLSGSLGKAESTLSEILSLNRLPDDIKNDCRKNAKISRDILVKIAKQRSVDKMRALYERYKATGLTRGEIPLTRLRLEKVVQDAPVDFSFVGLCKRRLDALDAGSLDSSQRQALLQELEKLRLAAYRKIKLLKTQPAPA